MGEFPLAWNSLAALRSDLGSEPWLLNRDHPLVQAIEAQDLEWFANYDRSPFSEDLLQTRGRSILYLLNLGQLELEWALESPERFRAGFWRDIWDLVAVEPEEIVTWAQPVAGYGMLRVLRPEGIELIPATDSRIAQYLPDPGDEWKLTITYREDSAGSGRP
jgi:hypothetical protein